MNRVDENHSFNIHVAGVVGIAKAVLLKELYNKCVYVNKSGYSNYGELPWHLYSAKQLAEKFTYMKASSIAGWLRELQNDGWIYSLKMSSIKRVRDKSYTVNFDRYDAIVKGEMYTDNDLARWTKKLFISIYEFHKCNSEIHKWIYENDKSIYEIHKSIYENHKCIYILYSILKNNNLLKIKETGEPVFADLSKFDFVKKEKIVPIPPVPVAPLLVEEIIEEKIVPDAVEEIVEMEVPAPEVKKESLMKRAARMFEGHWQDVTGDKEGVFWGHLGDSQKGKEFGQLKNLLTTIKKRAKKKQPDLEILDDIILLKFDSFLKQTISLKDNFYLNNFTPSRLNSQFATILTKITRTKNGKSNESQPKSSGKAAHTWDESKYNDIDEAGEGYLVLK